jgi:hypothetical protein
VAARRSMWMVVGSARSLWKHVDGDRLRQLGSMTKYVL